MPYHHRRFCLIVGALFLITISVLAVAVVHPATAQTAANVSLSPPDISHFPTFGAFLDIHNAQGEFVHGLQPSDVTILENGRELPVDKIQEAHPGVQLVIAMSPGESFLIRDSLGVTRYDYFKQAFMAGKWSQRPAGLDDLSLLITGGPVVLHSSDPQEIYTALDSYQLPIEAQIPDLESIAQALEIASDPLPRAGMERMLLFITAPQLTDVTVGMQSLAARASQQNIRIFVWLIAAADNFSLPGADQLRIPVEQTGGQFFGFSGSEAVPDLESILAPLRDIYRLEYTSGIVTGGAQQVAAQVTLDGETLLSEPQSFQIGLQPPAVSLLDAPHEIVRSYPDLAEQPSPEAAPAELQPIEQRLRIEVSFPDSFERPLTRTSLFVDDALAVENTAPPFDQFTWNLGTYVEDGLHSLRVEAVDSLGMTSESLPVTVQISVPSPAQDVIVAFSQQRVLVAGLVILLAGSVLLLVLVLGGRIRPKAVLQGPGIPVAARLGRKQEAQRRKDPVTQPVKIAIEPPPEKAPSNGSWIARLRWPQRKPAPKAVAYLTPLAEAGQAALPAPLPITADDVVLGSDPMQANFSINNPSVEAQHARLVRHTTSFVLLDLDTVAGTWVNYLPAGAEGMPLAHGDIIHIGGAGFRFTLREPGRQPRPVATPLEPRH